jgi:diacylglycerol kinase (ATP)
MQHLFIVNPTAGKGKSSLIIENINKHCSIFFDAAKISDKWEIQLTEYPGHATELAKAATEKYSELRVYSVGGDGTLNEIINGLVGSNAKLGIIPSGSGNDTLRSMTSMMDITKILDHVMTAESKSVDLGFINNRYFINISSMGLDGEVVRLTRKFKKMPFVSGPFAYILGTLSALVFRRTYKIKIELDGHDLGVRHLLLAAFANGRYYGGGMQPVPTASMNDGLLDLCTVDVMSRLRILHFLPLFQKGKHTDLKEVKISPFQHLHAESSLPIPVNIDGELSEETSLDITVCKSCLSVIIAD